MLMKLTPTVSFTNILQAAFLKIFFRQKLQSQTVRRENLRRTLSNEKAAFKRLVKLTPEFRTIILPPSSGGSGGKGQSIAKQRWKNRKILKT